MAWATDDEQLFGGLHKCWLGLRESEATRSPMSKDGTKGLKQSDTPLFQLPSWWRLAMSQTTEEIVNKTPARWRVLEHRGNSNSSCCTLCQVSFFHNTKLDAGTATGASWSIKGRYDLGASSSGRQGDTKKEDVKNMTGFRRGMKGRKATNCSAPQPLTHFGAQTTVPLMAQAAGQLCELCDCGKNFYGVGCELRRAVAQISFVGENMENHTTSHPDPITL